MIFGYPYSSTIMEWRLRRVVPAAAVTTHAKPHAQQQLARDLEVEHAVMGQRCRPQSSGPGLLCAAARFGFAVLKNNLSVGTLRFHTCCECYNKNYYENLLYFPDRVIFG